MMKSARPFISAVTGLAALIACASPAAARVRGSDYIETGCGGGAAASFRIVRLAGNGTLRAGRNNQLRDAGAIPAADALALFERLTASDFATLDPTAFPSGASLTGDQCWITRRLQGREHRFNYAGRSPMGPQTSHAEQEARAVARIIAGSVSYR